MRHAACANEGRDCATMLRVQGQLVGRSVLVVFGVLVF